MKSFERRNFLKKSIQLLIFSGLIKNQSINASLNDEAKSFEITPPLYRELREIHLCWEKEFNHKPEEFLALSRISSSASIAQISSQTINDFSEGNTIDVHGLVLSKTEAAFLASLYSYYAA